MIGNIFAKFFKVGTFSILGAAVTLAGQLTAALIKHSTPTTSWEDVARAGIAAAIGGILAALERWKNFDPNLLGK